MQNDRSNPTIRHVSVVDAELCGDVALVSIDEDNLGLHLERIFMIDQFV